MLLAVFCIVFLWQASVMAVAPSQCGRNEEWSSSSSPCPPTCEFQHPPCHKGHPVPRPGCICISGFLLLNSSKKMCIEPYKCPSECSKPNFIWNNCGTRCPKTCQQREPEPCVKICEPGCFCEKDFILNEINMECVKEEDCPK